MRLPLVGLSVLLGLILCLCAFPVGAGEPVYRSYGQSHHYDYGHGRYSVRDAYYDRQLADEIVERLRREFVTRGDLAELVQALKGQSSEEPLRMPLIGKEPIEPVSPVQKILDASCVKCHGKTNPDGDLDLSDADAVGRGDRWAVHGWSAVGDMPKSGKLLDAEQLEELYQWAREAPPERTR